MGLIDKIFNQSNKIKVQFIDNLNGKTIGVTRMNSDQLPETFSVPTTMHIQNADWSIEEAIPENSTDFIKSKNLVLKMRKVEKINTKDLWYSTPTISIEFPQTIKRIKTTEFDISIQEDDYRQREFLNMNKLTQIQEELVGIKDIWDNHSKKSENNILFKYVHVRKTIGSPNLTIDFNELKTLLNCSSVGQVIINGDVLANGFAISTDNTTYFGTLYDNKVTELCIAKWNDNTSNEILELNKALNLLFVNWYKYDLIKND